MFEEPFRPSLWTDPEGGTSSPGFSTQGQGQGEIEDQGRQQSSPHLIPPDLIRRHVQIYLKENSLVNAANWRFANSGFLSAFWGLLSCLDFDPTQLRFGISHSVIS